MRDVKLYVNWFDTLTVNWRPEPKPKPPPLEPLKNVLPYHEPAWKAPFKLERQYSDRKDLIREGVKKPRPYRGPIPWRCWGCGKVGHKSAQCPGPRIAHLFGCGEPGYTKATCSTCSELYESDLILAGRAEPRPDQYVIQKAPIVDTHYRAIHEAQKRNGKM